MTKKRHVSQYLQTTVQGDKQSACLNLGSTNPSYGGKIVLHEQMVRLVVETPLTDHQIRASVLNALDHILERLLLIISQALVLLHTRNIQLVFCFWPRGLEGTGEDGKFRVADTVRHLRM